MSLTFRGIKVFDGAAFAGPMDVGVSEGALIVPAGGEPYVTTVSGERRTLIPGFIDAHVHIGLHDAGAVLAAGVTTARDLAWPSDRIFGMVAELADSEAGPRLLAAGPMLTTPGGYPTRERWAPEGTGLEVTSANHGRDVVAELAERGAAVIKIAQEPRAGPVMTGDLVAAIAEAAHATDLRVTSHVGSIGQLEIAVDSGVDELAHGLWGNEPISASTTDRMIASRITVVPTLHIDPSPERIENLKAFVAAGGSVVYGTDMGNSGPPAGIDVAELVLMERAGMGRERALASATSAAAMHLGLPRLGRVAHGFSADIVIVEGDVEEDLRCLENVVMVLRGGKVILDRTKG